MDHKRANKGEDMYLFCSSDGISFREKVVNFVLFEYSWTCQECKLMMSTEFKSNRKSAYYVAR